MGIRLARHLGVIATLVGVILVVGSMAPTRPVHAAGMVVDTLADNTLTDGLCSLREAITNANANAAAYPDCAAGTGADTVTFSLSGTIVLAAALPDITDGAGLTIDGSGQSVTVSGDNKLRPFSVGAVANATLNALSVTGGRGYYSGVISNSGTLTVTNSVISGNTATGADGEGNVSNSGTLTVTNSTISANTGVGIRNSGMLTVTGAVIRGNSGGGYNGVGGIYNTGSMAVTNSSISGNSGSGYNGGGGIYNGGLLTVINSTISENTAESGGGGIANWGSATVASSTISGNIATDRPYAPYLSRGGGGIFNARAMTVVNSTISRNRGASASAVGGGGGILNIGTLALTNNTIAANWAASSGGGVRSSFTLSTTLTNSILAGNVAETGAPDCSGPVTTAGPNLIWNPWNAADCTITGTPPLTGDAKLGPLADNGGPTKTHALLPGSPAIDAGDDAVCAAAPVSGKDQRGVSRPQGAHCDLGAFELEASVPVVGGKNLRITTGSIDLAWDGGTAQTGYTLVQYNANNGTATLVPLPANATSYNHAAAVPGALYCYALAATGAGDVVLGLSDLECAMSGIKTGAVAPVGFALALNQSATATLTWTAPTGGADAYLLQRLSLDGSAPSQVTLPGSATISTQAVLAAGECFQLVAYQGSGWGSSDALCGIPGFSTLGKPADVRMQAVGEAMGNLTHRLMAFAAPTVKQN